MIKGFDVSSVDEIERLGGRYFENNIQKDPFEILKDHNINLTRIRLWNNPYDYNNVSYGAGTCDFECAKKLAKRSLENGMDYILDIFYSDFWADPGKQYPPKKWQKYNVDELELKVYEYTYVTVKELCSLNLKPSIVSIGNEITNGMLWPLGSTDNFENLVRFINAGIKAVRDVSSDIKIIIHLDRATDNEMFNRWFDRYFELGGIDFDYIGTSYYSFWHGSMKMLIDSIRQLTDKYNKPVIITETSSAWTLEPYYEYEGLSIEEAKGMATNNEVIKNCEFDISKQGQCDYIKAIGDLCNEIDKCLGFVYWGGESIPCKGFNWASVEALKYTHEEDKGPVQGNEWANQACFDYKGNVLPVLETIKSM